jgi:hypothetical protein
MTPVDTALVDACIETLVKDTPITRTFSNAISIMKIDIGETTDRQAQIRQLEDKLESMSRPEKRLSLLKLIRKLMLAEPEATKAKKG